MNKSDGPASRRVEVIEKLRDRLARQQHCLQERPGPLVTLAYAQSIDGCIAPFEGGTLQLSNSKSRQLTHQIRALHDAILVGINTVLCDDPQLNVRLAAGNDPQPVVLDTRLRFPLDANLLRDPCVRPVIVAGSAACDKKEERLVAAGARVIRVPVQENGLIDLSQLMPRLRQMGLHSIMVEGGARVITSILGSRVADQLLLAIAPRFVGGLRAVNATPAGEHLPALHDVHCQLMDGDLVVWGQLQPARGNGFSRAAAHQAEVSNPRPEC